MANVYTLFSEVIEEITEEEKVWIEEVLSLDPDESEITDAEFVEKLGVDDVQGEWDWWPGFEWKLKEGNLWLASSGSFCEGNLGVFVLGFTRKFRPDLTFSVNIAHFCDKPRVGEFGGSWMVVTRDGIFSGSTWGAIEDELEGK